MLTDGIKGPSSYNDSIPKIFVALKKSLQEAYAISIGEGPSRLLIGEIKGSSSYIPKTSLEFRRTSPLRTPPLIERNLIHIAPQAKILRGFCQIKDSPLVRAQSATRGGVLQNSTDATESQE